MNGKIVRLDVREEIRSGRPPFSKIMAAAAGLNDGAQLLLIAPFEPAPLFAVLARQGFRHESKRIGSDEWEVRFTREAPAANPASGNRELPAPGHSNPTVSGAEAIEVDARGLEPPQPMVTILEALAVLPVGAVLRARTDRRPMHLYAQFEARGFLGTTEEQSDGSFITEIRAR